MRPHRGGAQGEAAYEAIAFGEHTIPYHLSSIGIQAFSLHMHLNSTATFFLLLFSLSIMEPVLGFYISHTPSQGRAALAARQASVDTQEELTVLLSGLERKSGNSPEKIIQALRNVEMDQRRRSKEDKGELARTLQLQLVGDWQLMLVTDKRLKSVIYLPVRNIFSILNPSVSQDSDTTIFEVENAIRLGTWTLLSFLGTMEFDERKMQGLFDYSRFTCFNYIIDIDLKPGEAEKIVSSVEKRATSRKKPLFGAYDKPSSTRPFFNFFIANDDLAAARGSVGGFALWKRVS